MDKIELGKLKNTNSVFSTSIPWHFMGYLYSDHSIDLLKGLGLLELERIVYSVLLYDRIVINTYTATGGSFEFPDPISNILVSEGILTTLDGDFVNSHNFVETAFKQGSYGGLNLQEITEVLG